MPEGVGVVFKRSGRAMGGLLGKQKGIDRRLKRRILERF